jgi:hypothetical protein
MYILVIMYYYEILYHYELKIEFIVLWREESLQLIKQPDIGRANGHVSLGSPGGIV